MRISGAFEWEAMQGQPRVLTDRKRAISSGCAHGSNSMCLGFRIHPVDQDELDSRVCGHVRADRQGELVAAVVRIYRDRCSRSNDRRVERRVLRWGHLNHAVHTMRYQSANLCRRLLGPVVDHMLGSRPPGKLGLDRSTHPVSYTHLRAHETG